MITENTADYIWRGDGGPILLERTCRACPEQYNAFTADGLKVGYLRLRHGYFAAQIASPDGPVVYEARPEGDGIFTDGERQRYLDEACERIATGLQIGKALLFARVAMMAEPDDIECGLQDHNYSTEG